MLDLGNSVEHEGWSKMNSWRNKLFTKSMLTSEWKRKIPSKYKRTKKLTIS